MKEVIIVDTGIIVEYLKTGKGVLPAAYEKYEMHISAASFSELLASKTFEDENLEKEVLEFCHKYFQISDITEDIARKAAQLVRNYKINLATAYIAATSLVMKVKLLTDDKKMGDIDDVEILSL